MMSVIADSSDALPRPFADPPSEALRQRLAGDTVTNAKTAMNPKLAAVIVHDIKNALGVLEGTLHRMTMEMRCDDAFVAHETCISLRERLIAFLTLYKASSQGLFARVAALDPAEFLQQVLKTRVSSAPELRITVDATGAPALGFFDENLVGLALEAALQNAGRFARSAIEIGCAAEQNGGLRFTVRDDGIGLAAKEEALSTGLGMELCRAIACAHCREGRRGSASLHEHEAGGAVFTLHLP